MKIAFIYLIWFLLPGMFCNAQLHPQSHNSPENDSIPKKEKFIIHKADTRGETLAKWLIGKHSFSFNDYYDPDRMNFGALRVLNDDRIDPSKGFGTHPHNNMEIITIPLQGSIEHKDNMGNKGIINTGDVQIMSAGTGITHSEYNASKSDTLNCLQIWILPNKMRVKPRYQQINGIIKNLPTNSFKKIAAPNDTNALFLYQNSVFSIGEFNENTTTEYNMAFPDNGVYAFIITGSAKINGKQLSPRDGIGIWQNQKIVIHATENLKILLMDVPMHEN